MCKNEDKILLKYSFKLFKERKGLFKVWVNYEKSLILSFFPGIIKYRLFKISNMYEYYNKGQVMDIEKHIKNFKEFKDVKSYLRKRYIKNILNYIDNE